MFLDFGLGGTLTLYGGSWQRPELESLTDGRGFVALTECHGEAGLRRGLDVV